MSSIPLIMTLFPGLIFHVCYLHYGEGISTPHSSTLAWKTPWMEEAGRLQSIGSQRVRQD